MCPLVEAFEQLLIFGYRKFEQHLINETKYGTGGTNDYVLTLSVFACGQREAQTDT